MRTLLTLCVLTGLFANAGHADDTSVSDVPPLPIEWETDVNVAYQKALYQKQAMVVVFVTPMCDGNSRYSNRMRSTIFADEFQVLRDQAIFVICEIPQILTDADMESVEYKLFEQTEINGYPAVAVYAPTRETIWTIQTISGCFPAADLAGYVGEALTAPETLAYLQGVGESAATQSNS